MVKAAPLILIGVGLAVGFRANVWNIGAEGQLTVGAIAGGCVALAFWGEEGAFTLPLMCRPVSPAAAYAAVPAFLKTRFGVNEILTSLMLTYVATLFLSTLVYGPLADPLGFNFPQSRMFGDAALLPVILEGTRMHLGTLLALAVAVAGWVLMSFTIIGFQVRVLGQAPAAARFAGFSAKRIVWFCLLLSGGLAGLAGLFEVAGPIGQLIPSISPGYGFTAIIVAFLGRLHPLGIVLLRPAHGAVLHRRRDRAGGGRPAASGDRRVPGPAAVLPLGFRLPGALPPAPPVAGAAAPRPQAAE
jgi:general nucleoside transport system permease protein